MRKRTPVDLQHVERRASIRYSLETTDFREAVKRYPFKMAEIQADFERMRHELRERGKVSAALAVGKLERLSVGEVESLAAAWWSKREAYRQPPMDEDDPLAVLGEEEALLSRRDEGDGDPVRNLADQLLVDAGIASKPLHVGRIKTQVAFPLVDRSTAQYRYLCELITRALPLEVALARDALTLDKGALYDPLFNPAGRKVQGQSFDAPDHRLLRDLIDGYRREREALHGKESTDRKYGLLFRVLEEVVGAATPVVEIDRAKCVEVLTFLRNLPPNATKRFPKLSLAQAVAVAEEKGLPGLAPNTIGSYMQNLTAILNWAEQGGWGIKANTKGLIDTRRPQIKRRGFRPD